MPSALNSHKNQPFTKLWAEAVQTYIELVPPQSQGRVPPPFQPPPERYTSIDWIENIISIYRSVILKRILSHLLFTFLWTSLCCALGKFTNILPVFSDTLMWFLMGNVLSLLLVFRTNSAYDRFWESRRQIGEMVRVLRNIGRLTAQNIRDSETRTRVQQVLIAFPRFLVSHLEGDFSTQSEIATIMELRGIDTRMILAGKKSSCKMCPASRAIALRGNHG
jgi:ion channel-forming bestrophin family protein